MGIKNTDSVKILEVKISHVDNKFTVFTEITLVFPSPRSGMFGELFPKNTKKERLRLHS